MRTKQPTVREINAHTFAGTGSCYVTFPTGRRIRIARARTRAGKLEGRPIRFGNGPKWEEIPEKAEIELL
jgi:hypothetical protein